MLQGVQLYSQICFQAPSYSYWRNENKRPGYRSWDGPRNLLPSPLAFETTRHENAFPVKDVLPEILYSSRHGRSDNLAEEKRLLKIIRLKKERPPTDSLNFWNKDFNNRWTTGWGTTNDQNHENHNSPKSDQKIIFRGFSRLKKALKLIRLKKPFDPQVLHKWLSEQNNPEKRLLKVIRLKKSRDGEKDPTVRYLSPLNPAAKIRFDRRDLNPAAYYFRYRRSNSSNPFEYGVWTNYG